MKLSLEYGGLISSENWGELEIDCNESEVRISVPGDRAHRVSMTHAEFDNVILAVNKFRKAMERLYAEE